MSSTVRSLPHAHDTKIVALNAPAVSSVSEARPSPQRAPARPSRAARARAALKRWLLNALPPLVAVGAIVGVWELVCAAPDASLPQRTPSTRNQSS